MIESHNAWYRVLAVALVLFGIVGAASIGMPFFLIGITLIVMGPYRGRPAIFWPPLIAMLALTGGFVLTAPTYCSTSTSISSGQGSASNNWTVCSNLIGIDYSGPGNYNPSLLPALATGLATAAVLGTLSRFLIKLRQTP